MIRRNTKVSACAIRAPALRNSAPLRHVKRPELDLHVQQQLTFCTRRTPTSASPSRDFASTVASELRKHTPEKDNENTYNPFAWAASVWRRSARKVENHNLYSAMWQHLWIAAVLD